MPPFPSHKSELRENWRQFDPCCQFREKGKNDPEFPFGTIWKSYGQTRFHVVIRQGLKQLSLIPKLYIDIYEYVALWWLPVFCIAYLSGG